VTRCDNLWVIIPAFNEGAVIREVVTGVHARYAHVVVIDDCSQDETCEAALLGGAVVLRHPINLGQGASLQTGLRYAHDQGAEYIVTFDGDGQHRVEDIGALLEVQIRSGAEIVVGSRFLGAVENLPLLRELVLRIAVRFARITSGVSLTDVHNGLRLLTRRAAEQIRITQNRMAHASEIIAQAHRLGLSIAEAPVTIIYTKYSLRKGQRLSNAFNILAELITSRLNR
jgi:glycosyltransferase involved in cell wall biosynthesis